MPISAHSGGATGNVSLVWGITNYIGILGSISSIVHLAEDALLQYFRKR